MGAIQSSFNQLLVTASAGLGMASHLKEQQIANEGQAINSYKVAYNDAENLKQEVNATNTEIDKLNKDIADNKTNAEAWQKKKADFDANVKEGVYTERGAKMLGAKLQKSYDSLKEQGDMLTQQKNALQERIKILQAKKDIAYAEASHSKRLIDRAGIKIGGKK